jgi:tryptophan 2,3-dioxygenase
VLHFLQEQLVLLRTMQPWDYHAIRRTLGHGSGLDSPGYRRILAVALALWHAFEGLLAREGADLESVYVQASRYPALVRLAEALMDYDEGLQRFRYEHLRVTQRTIGPDVMGTGGMAVRDLERGVNRMFFPPLWEVRDRLTARASEPSS